MGWELRSARYLAAEMQERVLRPGDTAVDATLGNGHDALRLAALVGETGRFIGFDIQRDAVERSAQRLREAGLLQRCELHAVSHDRLSEFVPAGAGCIVFNLGWLPGGDKHITTRWESTGLAVRSALALLRPEGLLTVCAYPGHAAGAEELRHLTDMLAELPPQEYNVLHERFLNAGPGAPECFAVQRQADRNG